MANNIINQKQICKSLTYDDNFPSGESLQSLAASLEDDLNAIRSQLNKIIGKDNWYDEPDTNLNELQSSGINIWSVIGTDSGTIRPRQGLDTLFLLGSSGIRTYITDTPGEEDTIYIESTRNMFTSIEGDSGTTITASSSTDDFSVVGGAGIEVLATQSGFSFSYSGIDPQQLWFRIEANDGLATVANTTRDTFEFSGGWGISTRIDAPDTVVYISDVFDGTNTVNWENIKLTGINPNSIIFLDEDQCFAGNDDFVYNSTTKSVGVGTDFPAESLHVRGTLLQTLESVTDTPVVISEDTDSNSLYFASSTGEEALAYYNNIIVAVNSSGLEVYRLLDKDDKVQHLSTIVDANLAGSKAAQIVGHNIYVAGTYLAAYDLRNPKTPSQLFNGSLAGETALSMFIHGGFAYVGANEIIWALNIKEEDNPTFHSGYTAALFLSNVTKIDVYRNNVFIIANGARDCFASFSPAPNFVLRDNITGYDASFDPRDMAFYGDYAYIVTFSGNKLYVVNISDVDDLQVVNVVTPSPSFVNPCRIDVLGRHLIVTNIDNVMVFDLKDDPVNPVYLGEGDHSSAGVMYRGRGFVNSKNLYLADTSTGNLNVVSLKGLDVVAANIGSLAADKINLDGELNVSNRMNAGTLNSTGQSINVYSDFGISLKSDSNIIGSLNIGSFEAPTNKVTLDGADIWCGPRKDPKGTSNEVLVSDLEEAGSDYADILSLQASGNHLFVGRGYNSSGSINKTLHIFRQTGWSPVLESVSVFSEGDTGHQDKIKVIGNKLFRLFDVEIKLGAPSFALVSANMGMSVYDLSNNTNQTEEVSQISGFVNLAVEDGDRAEAVSSFDVQGDTVVFVTTKGRIIISQIERYENNTSAFYVTATFSEDKRHVFTDVQLDGDYMYVTTSTGDRWAKYDISDIYNPTLLGALSPGALVEEGNPTYGVVHQGYLYFVDENGYSIYNVSSDLAIQNYANSRVGIYEAWDEFREPFKVILNGNYSYVLCGYDDESEKNNAKVVVFDVRNASNSAPSRLGEITFTEDSEFPVDFAVLNNVLYVAFSEIQKIYGYDLGQLFSGTADIGQITAYDLLCTQKGTFHRTASVYGNIEAQNGNVLTSSNITAKKFSGQQFGIMNTSATNSGYVQSDMSLVVSGYSGEGTLFASSSVGSDVNILAKHTYQTIDFVSNANASRYWHVQAAGVYEITVSGGIIITESNNDQVTITIFSNGPDFTPGDATVLYEQTFPIIDALESPQYHSVTYKGRIEADTYVGAFIQGTLDTVYFAEGSQFTIVKVG